MEDESSNKGGRAYIWGGILLIAGFAVAIALFLSLIKSSDTVTVDKANVVVDGQALEVFAGNGAPDPAVGMAAPGLRGVSPYGSNVVVDVADGKPKLVVFLAHWCHVCQAEVPKIVEWVGPGIQTNGVDVYGVATAVDETKGNYPPGVWLRGEKWPFPSLLDTKDKAAATAYGLSAFPFFVAVDAQGNVVARASGALDQAEFNNLLEAARTGTPYVVETSGDQTKAPS